MLCIVDCGYVQYRSQSACMGRHDETLHASCCCDMGHLAPSLQGSHAVGAGRPEVRRLLRCLSRQQPGTPTLLSNGPAAALNAAAAADIGRPLEGRLRSERFEIDRPLRTHTYCTKHDRLREVQTTLSIFTHEAAGPPCRCKISSTLCLSSQAKEASASPQSRHNSPFLCLWLATPSACSMSTLLALPCLACSTLRTPKSPQLLEAGCLSQYIQPIQRPASAGCRV